MSQKTIAQVFAFVILACGFAACLSSSSAPPPDPLSPYAKPERVGTLRSSDIEEASGLAASRCQPDVIWTHNDSGGGPFVFAIRPTGESLGTWHVPNARSIDWEDIAAYKDSNGKCFIYIGDIGDNNENRPQHSVYRIQEPSITPDSRPSTRAHPLETALPDIVNFTYPDGNHNSETLLVHPATGDIYVVTKRLSGPAGVYKIGPNFNDGTQDAKLIAEITVPAVPNGFLTGGDISPDGKRVILSDYVAAYEWSLPAGGAFDDVWKQPLVTVDIGRRDTGEAVCYGADGNSLLSTSEGDHAPIYLIRQK